jgi:hypothetical protein
MERKGREKKRERVGGAGDGVGKEGRRGGKKRRGRRGDGEGEVCHVEISGRGHFEGEEEESQESTEITGKTSEKRQHKKIWNLVLVLPDCTTHTRVSWTVGVSLRTGPYVRREK